MNRTTNQPQRRRPWITFWLVAGCLCLWSGTASAADYKKGPNAFAFHIGGQGGFVGWAPGGAKLFFEYNRYLSGRMWLDIELNPVFGDRWGHDYDHCHWDPGHDHWHCDNWHYRGSALELFGGVKWRFYPISKPLVPYARVGGIVAFLSYPDGVNGFALAARGGGGFKYFFLKNFGVGVEANLALGFGVLNHGIGFDLYFALDLGVGIEVLF